MSQYLAVDIGGTFTDTVALDGATGEVTLGKALTTPDDLVEGVFASLRDGGARFDRASLMIHGSTLVINALIQRNGALTALITTEGARDVYEIGRINRPDSFNLRFTRPVPLVPRKLRFEVGERIGPDGGVVDALDEASLAAVLDQIRDADVEAVAITLLHSYRNPEHEKRIAELVRDALPGKYVCASHEISREYREYERTSTAVANAYVGPQVTGYLARLEDSLRAASFGGALLIMQSNGGLMDLATAGRQCIQMLESGPAGGVNGVQTLSAELGAVDVIAFDMGGTTAKATVVRDGQAQMAEEYFVGDYATGLPLRVPAIDVKEVGTGGGSIAWLDDANGFHVGPRSAGASPGPAAYGLGGTEPTVTDANVVLGRLEAGNFGDVGVRLDHGLATTAVESLAKTLELSVEEAALGILDIATAAMADAVRAVTVKRGLDPRDFTLVAYGGAGPLHAAAVARELGCSRLVVPDAAGVFSAYGMLSADLRRDLVQSCFISLASADAAEALESTLAALEAAALAEIDAIDADLRGLQTRGYADVRYVGQEHTLTISIPPRSAAGWVTTLKADFDTEHGIVYAHSAPDEPAEVVSLRMSALGQLEGMERQPASVDPGAAGAPTGRRNVVFDDAHNLVPTDVWRRTDVPMETPISGPAVVEEVGTSLLVWPGSTLVRARSGVIVIENP